MATTILVIEDDSSVAGLLEDLLSEEGFTVLVERDGEWGLRTFEERGADLVLLDILLPKLQGFDLIPRLRALPSGADVPLLVMSGVFRSATYLEQLRRRHGVHAYFDKPLDTESLLEALREVLGDRYPEAPKPRSQRAALQSQEPHEAPVSVPEKGDIEAVPFARLLGLCFRGRVTGALMLRRESIKKIIYFKEGIPVFVRSNLLDECLGRIMVDERLITQKECERSLELKRKSTGKRQGEILVEMGSISQHNLQFALELQMQMKLYEVFSWLDGTFQLNPQADYTGPQVALSMGPTALIHEGAGRAMSTERIKKDLGKLSHRPLLPSSDPTFRYQAQQLDPDAEALLDLIDGTRNTDALLDITEMPPDAAALLLYALFCAGLLLAPEPPPALPEAPVAVEDQDLELLRTDEIDAVAALEEVAPELAAAHPGNPEASGKALARALFESTRGSSDEIDVLEAPTVGPELDQSPSPEPTVEPEPEPSDEPEVISVAEPEPEAEPEARTSPPPVPDESDEPESVESELDIVASEPEAAAEPQEAPEPDEPHETEPELDVVSSEPAPAAPPATEPAPSEARAALEAQLDEAADPDETPAASDEIESETDVPAPRPAPPVSPLGPEPGARLSSSLPRTSTWASAPSVGATDPGLSDELRQQVRARLEAQAARLATTPTKSEPKRPLRPERPKRRGLSLDLEQERVRIEAELREDLTRLEGLDHYARLELTPGAPEDEVERGYDRLSRRMDPERVLAGLSAPDLRLLAERRIVLLRRAYATLSDAEARARYHTQLGLERQPDDAPLLAADEAYARGLACGRAEDWDGARAAFTEAVKGNPSEGIYISHLAWATHAAAPDDEDTTETALELLRKAAELNPRHEAVYVFAGRLQRRIGRSEAAREAYQRALRCNPDCVEALEAARELEPEPTKRGGLFSRFTR